MNHYTISNNMNTTTNMKTTNAAGLLCSDTTIVFTCGCKYSRTSQLPIAMTSTNSQTEFFAEGICLACDMKARIDADLAPMSPDDSMKSMDLTAQYQSIGKIEPAQGIAPMTDVEQADLYETAGMGIHPAIEAGLAFADDVAEMAAKLSDDLKRLAPEGSELYLVAEEEARNRFIDGAVSDDEYDAFFQNYRIPADRCHCPACLTEDEIPPTDLSEPASCDRRPTAFSFIEGVDDKLSITGGDASPLGCADLEDGYFDEAFSLLDDNADATSTIRWTVNSADLEAAVSSSDFSSVRVRDSLDLPYHNNKVCRRVSVYSEQSFDLPIQQTESPVIARHPRAISTISGAYQELLLEPFRLDVALDDADSIFPLKEGPPLHRLRKLRRFNTNKCLLQRVKSKIISKIASIKRAVSSSDVYAHMRG